MGIIGASQVAQRLKHLPAMRETWVWSLGWEDSLEKEMATHSSILAWKIPRTQEPGRLQSMGLQRVGHILVSKQHCILQLQNFCVVVVNDFFLSVKLLNLSVCYFFWFSFIYLCFFVVRCLVVCDIYLCELYFLSLKIFISKLINLIKNLQILSFIHGHKNSIKSGELVSPD